MKKNAWPWIGSVENEMGSMGPKNEGKDKIEDSQERHDTLVTEKSVLEDAAPTMTYENGIMSPVAEVSFAKDTQEKEKNKNLTTISVFDQGELLATFSCNVARTFQEKVAGLQPYNELKESAGLIFEYQRPEDVLYHMGTVKFAIDILFINAENKIKKLYKNIQPNTLGTFGCAGVKTVLEICGGLSDRLGIKVGDTVESSKLDSDSVINHFNKMSKEIGVEKHVIIKYATLGRNGFSNWKGFPILTINDSIDKQAKQSSLITDLVSNFDHYQNRKIIAFDFDGLIAESPSIQVYETEGLLTEEQVPHIKIDGQTTGISSHGREITFDKLASLKSNEAILISNKSLGNFLSESNDFEKLSNYLRFYSNKPEYKIVVATRSTYSEFQELLSSKLQLCFGETLDFELVRLSNDADATDLIEKISSIYHNNQVELYTDSSIFKRAGKPIPDDVKNKAKRAYKLLDNASNTAETSLENMKKNLTEYEKIKDNPDAIARSKGQYNQSVRNNTRVLRELLIRIRDAIKIFNDIKDVSTTMEIIDGLTSSVKATSDAAEEIFDLIEQLESADFHILLKEKVDSYERIIEDLNSSIDRGKNYVNSNILGLKVLSD